ncbi:jmjC domain-containing protein 8 isoform X3 [Pogoniulus pusillus]|uniref:jmjC domain-containing protein 8 isoform X3 n=1 Tax=Pogoniulus pusillus TaxID=488313 RepID=UPI0030B92310
MAAARWRLLPSLLLPLTCAWASGSTDPPDGGWLAGAVPEEQRCTVERADASLTYPLFLQRYGRPLARRQGSLSPGRSSSAESRTIRHSVPSAPGRSCWRLLGRAWCGSAPPTPTRTAKLPVPAVDVPFQEYVEQLLKPQDPARLGSDTLYFFGDNNFTEWGHLFQQYVPPPFRIPGTSPAYSFGIAGSGSGVPFHWHGPGYSEVIFGRKRWFLYPPDQAPHFHPNETTLAWLHHTYPTLPPAQRPLECTLRPGEVLYFPDRWWHATLNLDTSVFISTFLG